MPRTALTNIIEPTRAGVAFPQGTLADAANGNSIVNNGRVMVIAINSSASTVRNVTVTPTATVDGLAAAARTSPIPTSSSILLGPWDVGNYGAALQISADSSTDVRFQIIRFPG
ncbi:hypothetical protein Ade02nite_19760 [Paractinoplanes deccanensis]|uniref:Uncharacterized protein n=1 Tax=Paractinoplanes deccanensis TaxID=113561 RepID=A0ABQ3Y0F4_9ACTN|nr:hypothetical protein [Actinoplanes deccanensis]GID73335.1 hypothetical protein Ade02nite_19760 [Actinoplanes deccanensis]